MRMFTIAAAVLLTLPAAIFGAIRGTIVTIDGVAAAGAKVAAYRQESWNETAARLLSASPDAVPLATAESDAQGAWALDTKQPMPVRVVVSKSGFAPATAVALADDDLGAILVRGAGTAKGRVTAGGSPVPNALVVWSVRNGVGYAARTDEKGEYTVPDPKIWATDAFVRADGFAPVFRPRVMNGPIDANFALSRGKSVAGKVVGADGNGVAKASIVVDGWPLGVTADDGTFAIDRVSDDWKEIVASTGDRVASMSRAKPQQVLRLMKSSSITVCGTDAKTRKALPGMTVDIRPAVARFRPGGEGRAYIADAKGCVAIAPLFAGEYDVNLAYPGYSAESVIVQLRSGEWLRRGLAAEAMAIVSGSVIDDVRKPVGAARVLPRQTDRAPMRMIAPGPSAWSGADGRFVLRVTPERDVSLRAFRRGFPEATGNRMTLASGEKRGGVVLTIPRGLRLAGKVTNAAGAPIGGVSVSSSPARGGGPASGRVMIRMGRPSEDDAEQVLTSSDGSFEVHLKEDKYDFTFEREGYAPKAVRAVEVSASTEPLAVTLDPGVSIRGRVIRTSGEGVADANVLVVGGIIEEPVRTAPDGSFEIDDLEPGPTMLIVNKSDEFIRENRNVEAPASNVEIKIASGVTVSGRVTDKSTQSPVTDFQAGISQTRSSGGRVMVGPPSLREFHSDDGTFVLDHLPAGVQELIVSSPGYVTKHLPGIALEEGKPVTDLEVALESGVRLTGRVTGPDGSALAGVTVSLDQATNLPVRMPAMNNGVTTDGSGEYSLDSIEPAEKSFTFEKEGYLTEHRSLTLSGREARLDVRMSKGTRVTGVVTTEAGSPVEGASVMARSSARDAGNDRTETDDNGAFAFEGLTPGRYRFDAGKSGYAHGSVSDVDVTSVGTVRVVLKTGAAISGHILGLSAADLSNVEVFVNDQPADAPVDANGAYRVEGVEPGTVTVAAMIVTMTGRKSSPSKTVDVAAGAEATVDLEFRSDVVIRGRVTKNGQPVSNVLVAFNPEDVRIETDASTRADADGNYEVTGLEDGVYNVDVFDMTKFTSFRTRTTVAGSGRFDIDVRAATVRGQVSDGDTGELIVGASVSLTEAQANARPFGPASTSDQSGNFSIESVTPGQYRALARKEGYGQQILDVVVDETGADGVSFKLHKNDGLVVRVVDGRDGRALEGYFRVRDAQNREAFRGPATARADGAYVIPVAAGTYRMSVMVSGYAARTTTVTSPSAGITVAMTPGGMLVVNSSATTTQAVQLVDANGDGVSQSFWYAVPLTVSPGRNELAHLAPGAYTLVILGEDNRPKSSKPVTIVEGGTTEVSI